MGFEPLDIDRASVKHRGAVLAGVVGSGLQQGYSHTLPTVFSADREVGDLPC